MDGVADADEYVFAARLEAGVRHPVAKLGVEHGQARAAERHAGVRIGSTWRGVGGVVRAHAAVESGHWRRRIAQLARDRDVVAELSEVAAHRQRKAESVRSVDAGGGAWREWGHRVGVGAGGEVAAEILKARARLDRIGEAVGKPA